ncbi:MAG: lytic transglycosylase domain-containing protein [Silicimonas sp.]|nr:lytic transglycosylase domain-containing protein [Silicimonas sp.]
MTGLKHVVVAVIGAALFGGGALAEDGPKPEPRFLPTVEEEPIELDLSGRPAPRDNDLPRARWEYRARGDLWTRVALAAVATHGSALLEAVPRDIGEWCPAYPANDSEDRAAFWAALLSTLARYESTWNPRAVGGGGRWFGLMQIYPSTAEFRDCRVQTGEALKHGPSNLNCAVRIMAITVPRDNAISVKDGRWRGVAADWGPIRNDWMRRDMQRYTRRQTYCRPLSQVRPKMRP